MKKISGKEFEALTEEIYRQLVKNTEFEKVERNVRIDGPDGKRQIDILLTVETMGTWLVFSNRLKIEFLTLTVQINHEKNQIHRSPDYWDFEGTRARSEGI